MGGQLLDPLRARRAARRMLGATGPVVGTTQGGSPIVEVAGHRLAFRRHSGDTYFRFVLPCDECGGSVTSRAVEVRSAEDLDRDDVPAAMCRPCRANREDQDPDPALLKAKLARERRLT